MLCSFPVELFLAHFLNQPVIKSLDCVIIVFLDYYLLLITYMVLEILYCIVSLCSVIVLLYTILTVLYYCTILYCVGKDDEIIVIIILSSFTQD